MVRPFDSYAELPSGDQPQVPRDEDQIQPVGDQPDGDEDQQGPAERHRFKRLERAAQAAYRLPSGEPSGVNENPAGDEERHPRAA